MSLKTWLTDYAQRWANDPPYANISYVYNSIFGDSGSYGSGTSVDYDSYKKNLSQLLSTMNSTNSTSAYNAALAAARETNNFNANQAALNRQFQQSSAEREMAFNAEQAALNRQFQQASADKQMEFERDMSNTAYQRAVSDLKAAGLSPLLAYSNFQTTSPAGAMASGSTASGASASGSSASGVRPDTSNALDVERKTLDRLLSILALNVNSAYKLVDAIVPGISLHN